VPRIALTVAGSDSGGGAGIQADLGTFRAFDVLGTCALTAVTAQNTLGVVLVHALPPAVVLAQMRAVTTDLAPGAVKLGMLGTGAVARAVAEELSLRRPPHLVVDPVLVATSGDALADDDVCTTLRRYLLPLADLLTPNLAEAETLTGQPVRTLDEARDAARSLTAMGARAALVTGGHLDGAACDILAAGADTWEIEAPRVPGPAVHGTGCTLSAAIAARLLYGDSVLDAVVAAKRYLTAALRQAHSPGGGAPLLGTPDRTAADVKLRIRSC
jgi:hydroxymethylpyrimidine/phosphomethylpyrimidine kinase